MNRGPTIEPQQQLHARTEALLRRLVRRDASGALRKMLAKSRPEDIAAAMEHLTWAEQRRLFATMRDRDFAAQVLSSLSEESAREVVRELPGEHVADLLDRMEPDDATDVVAVLPEQVREDVLARLSEDVDEVRELLAWPSDSAGGLMSPLVFTQPRTATCADAIQALQEKSEEFETVYYVYVVDEEDRLVGVTSLRSLLTSPPVARLDAIMTRTVVNVHPTEDQEEVARYVARYDLLAIPVVDEGGHILGVVTVDDVIDVIKEEAAEDMMLMAGVSEGQERNVLRQSWNRAGWLLATIVGGILAAEIIGTYEETLQAVAVLAGFIPVIMGMGGNVGIQSATLAVRGLATGRIQLRGAMGFVVQEAWVGLALGAFYAVLLGAYGTVRYPDQPLIGLSVGASIFLAIASASVLGASIPLGLQRAGVDPAIATGPFVTTLVDLLGIVIYFNVARMLLGL